MGFEDSYTVDLYVGDLLIMPPGQIHGVDTPQNGFLVGAHFILAETLVSTLKAATRHLEYLSWNHEWWIQKSKGILYQFDRCISPLYFI